MNWIYDDAIKIVINFSADSVVQFHHADTITPCTLGPIISMGQCKKDVNQVR